MLKTKDIIKMLPFDEKFKTKLFNEFDDLDESVKPEVIDVIWNGYCIFYKQILNENIQKGLSVGETQTEEKLDGTFYQGMVEKTEKELNDNLNSSDSVVDLSAAREELEKIIGKTN